MRGIHTWTVEAGGKPLHINAVFPGVLKCDLKTHLAMNHLVACKFKCASSVDGDTGVEETLNICRYFENAIEWPSMYLWIGVDMFKWVIGTYSTARGADVSVYVDLINVH